MSSSTPAAPRPPETGTPRSPRRARLALVGLFALFFVPILLAYGLNVLFPDFAPFGTSNRGVLIEPARSIGSPGLRSLDGQPLADAPFTELWTLVAVHAPGCPAACENALVRMRQTRLALGKDADRLQRWLVVIGAGEAPVRALLDGYPGMRVLHASEGWLGRLAGDPSEAQPGALYLIDPQGFLVLRYDATLPDDAALKDLKRLLRISKVG